MILLRPVQGNRMCLCILLLVLTPPEAQQAVRSPTLAKKAREKMVVVFKAILYTTYFRVFFSSLFSYFSFIFTCAHVGYVRVYGYAENDDMR